MPCCRLLRLGKLRSTGAPDQPARLGYLGRTRLGEIGKYLVVLATVDALQHFAPARLANEFVERPNPVVDLNLCNGDFAARLGFHAGAVRETQFANTEALAFIGLG